VRFYGSEHPGSEVQSGKLIERARSGDEVIIAKAGTPLVRLVPVAEPRKRVFGGAKGLIKFKKGWDAPMTERELDGSSTPPH
jgi:antitoxin (DNA-binding transcriptional repressor) of toxin-antitoxin stability system